MRADKTNAGFSVPAALFIVLILAGLAAFLITISSGQQLGHAQDVLGSRALQAARSGADWGVYQVLNTAGDVSANNFHSNCSSGSASATMASLPGIPGLTIQVSCSSRPYTEGAESFHAYQIVATACTSNPCPPATSAALPTGYVERRVMAVVVN